MRAYLRFMQRCHTFNESGNMAIVNKHRLLLLLLLGFVCVTVSRANTPIVQPNLSMKTKISPAYFGPNAFQVPEMLDGRTSSQVKVRLSADYYSGTLTTLGGDVTAGMSAKCIIPLFSSRVNLSLWMPVFEYYYVNSEVNQIRRVPYEGELEGWDSGDVYVSTDIQLFTQSLHGADMVLRTALKSASGNTYSKARYYDAPGYFFDVAIGRDLVAYAGTVVRVAASTGFLCWQTDVGRQNDAVMYGIQASWTHGKWDFKSTFGGYVGWEGDGDQPMVMDMMMSYMLKHFAITAQYKIGIMDWPFNQASFGLVYCY